VFFEKAFNPFYGESLLSLEIKKGKAREESTSLPAGEQLSSLRRLSKGRKRGGGVVLQERRGIAQAAFTHIQRGIPFVQYGTRNNIKMKRSGLLIPVCASRWPRWDKGREEEQGWSEAAALSEG